MANLANKTRDVEKPYEIWVNERAGWEWRVLRKYKTPENEAKDTYAAWFCAVRSPHTYGSWEYGDTYVYDVVTNATLKFRDPVLADDPVASGVGRADPNKGW
jgi:hypothetical protein